MSQASSKVLYQIFIFRIKEGANISFTPLMHLNHQMRTFQTKDGLVGWKTTTDSFEASVVISLCLNSSKVFFTTKIINALDSDLKYDLVFGQDLALADEGGVKSNECYVSQYLDHQVFELDEYGYVVCSRQNLPQSSGNPCSQIGSITDKVVGYSTDGYQFFGKDYRFEPTPSALAKPTLENVKFQFEMGYVALQTDDVVLGPKQSSESVFYITFERDLPTSNVQQATNPSTIKSAYVEPRLEAASYQELPSFFLNGYNVLKGETLSSSEIETFFGKERRFKEAKDGDLLSFFYSKHAGDSRYVTLPEKEKILERSTGHMVSSGNCQDFKNSIISSTHGMYGVFNSHVVIGNTSFNKLLGVDRTALNLFKYSGQRIWVKEGDTYRILTMPSAYETGLNFSRWIYKYQQGYIFVTSFSSNESPSIQLDIETIDLKKSLDVVVTNQLLMGNNENEASVQIERVDNLLKISGDCELIQSTYPDMYYVIRPDASLAEISTVETANSTRYLLFQGKVQTKASLTITGILEQGDVATIDALEFNSEVGRYHSSQNELINNFHVEFANDSYNSQKLNDTMQWFTHNALVHYSTPHGLEQYSGAAWGYSRCFSGAIRVFHGYAAL